LGQDEQAMLLRALEEGQFLPLGSDRESESDFQLIAGTNRDLHAEVRSRRFREDLLSRMDLWTFRLPGLRERTEDIEPNLNYELEEFARRGGTVVTFNREARTRFIEFAVSRRATWSANFRDLNGAVTRMATLAQGGRITPDVVEDEIKRLMSDWYGGPGRYADDILVEVLGARRAGELDLFDAVQLSEVLRICRRSSSLSAAGRALFSESRKHKKSANDADRLRKYLAKYDLDWSAVSSRP
jgi:transcriptional regulatory protein RtcR